MLTSLAAGKQTPFFQSLQFLPRAKLFVGVGDGSFAPSGWVVLSFAAGDVAEIQVVLFGIVVANLYHSHHEVGDGASFSHYAIYFGEGGRPPDRFGLDRTSAGMTKNSPFHSIEVWNNRRFEIWNNMWIEIWNNMRIMKSEDGRPDKSSSEAQTSIIWQLPNSHVFMFGRFLEKFNETEI